MAFRKLREYPKSISTMQTLENFIRTVIGKKYKLNAAKIFTKHF
jgi:hypothetical protein